MKAHTTRVRTRLHQSHQEKAVHGHPAESIESGQDHPKDTDRQSDDIVLDHQSIDTKSLI